MQHGKISLQEKMPQKQMDIKEQLFLMAILQNNLQLETVNTLWLEEQEE